MSSNFECFIKICGQTFDLIIKNSSFGYTFDSIFGNIKQIVKLAINEDIDISTHDFEIFEFLSIVGTKLKRLDQSVTHKSTVCITRKVQPLVSHPYVYNHTTSTLIVPQIQHPIPHHTLHPVPQHIPQYIPQHSPHIPQQRSPFLSKPQHLPQEVRQQIVYNKRSDRIYERNAQPTDYQRQYVPQKRLKPNTPPKRSQSFHQSSQQRPNPKPVRFNLNTQSQGRPDLRPFKAFESPNKTQTNKSVNNYFNSKPKDQNKKQSSLISKPQLIKEEPEIQTFHSIVMAMNIGWNYRNNTTNWSKVHQIMSRGQNRNDSMFGAGICTRKFYNWTHFYAENYEKLNGKLDTKCQKIFDLLKIVHILDLDKLFSEFSPTAVKIKVISKRPEFREYYDKYLKRIRMNKVDEMESEPKATGNSGQTSTIRKAANARCNSVKEKRPNNFRDKCRKFSDIAKIIKNKGQSVSASVPTKINPKTPQTLRKSDKPVAAVVRDFKKKAINSKQISGPKTGNTSRSEKEIPKSDKNNNTIQKQCTRSSDPKHRRPPERHKTTEVVNKSAKSGANANNNKIIEVIYLD